MSEISGPNWEQFSAKVTGIAGLTQDELSRMKPEEREKLLKEYNVHESRMKECLANWETTWPTPSTADLENEAKAKKEKEDLEKLGAPIVSEFEKGQKVILLPQQETRFNWYKRVDHLNKMKVEYQFDFYPGNIGPPYCREIPERELSCATKEHNNTMVFDIIKSTVTLGFRKVVDSIGDFFRTEAAFQDYDDMYKKDEAPIRPAVSSRWRTDIEFARQRLQGVLPIMIQRVEKELPSNFPLTDADINGIVENGATIKTLIHEKRLYLVDYNCCKGVADIAPKENNFVEPIMAFYVTKTPPEGETKNCLMPLGIQLYQEPSKGPIFTPKDDADGKNLWFIAKIHAQCTEASWHEVPCHLLATHLIMESVYVAMMRTVSVRHPVSELISAHFWYTLKINASARENLMAPGGVVPKVMSMGYGGMVEILTRGWHNWDFNRYNVPLEVEKRGCQDADALPGYYYRDDGIPVFEAIQRYVSKVLDKFYIGGDADVVADFEIQNWVTELVDKERVGCQGTPFVNGKCETLDQLKLFVTEVIWGSSGLHAVLNNGQYDFLGYIPNVPGIFKLTPPANKDKGYTEKEIAAAMPTYGYASEQIAFLHLLSMPTDQPLGHFSHKPDYFKGHNDVHHMLKGFNDELGALSQSIQERNKGLSVPYTYLDPAQIASGIAI